MIERKATVTRNTLESQITIMVNLDGSGHANLDTPVPFLNHMLDQIARHGNMDLTIKVKGDLEVDEHHTMEDTAIVLGEAFGKVLNDKRGIERYGFTLPMDDCLAQVAIDFSGRSWLVWNAAFKREKVGDFPTEMVFHFFKSSSNFFFCSKYLSFLFSVYLSNISRPVLNLNEALPFAGKTEGSKYLLIIFEED